MALVAPGMKAHLWGYNGQPPGPTIEGVEGDKVPESLGASLSTDTPGRSRL